MALDVYFDAECSSGPYCEGNAKWHNGNSFYYGEMFDGVVFNEHEGCAAVTMDNQKYADLASTSCSTKQTSVVCEAKCAGGTKNIQHN